MHAFPPFHATLEPFSLRLSSNIAAFSNVSSDFGRQPDAPQ